MVNANAIVNAAHKNLLKYIGIMYCIDRISASLPSTSQAEERATNAEKQVVSLQHEVDRLEGCAPHTHIYIHIYSLSLSYIRSLTHSLCFAHFGVFILLCFAHFPVSTFDADAVCHCNCLVPVGKRLGFFCTVSLDRLRTLNLQCNASVLMLLLLCSAVS